MKTKKPRWSVLIISVCTIAALVLGTSGYLMTADYQSNFPGSLYAAVRMFTVNTDVKEPEVNWLIEAARWLAVVATTTVLWKILQFITNEIVAQVKALNSRTIVIHGNGPRKDAIEAALISQNEKVIVSDTRAQFKAKTHVLAFEKDTEALKFLREHERELYKEGPDKKEIYLCSYDLEPSDYTNTGLIVSNHAVNCARQYWSENWLYKENSQRKEPIQVAIVGFGKYGKRLLEQGLLVNIMPNRPPIHYHIYGTNGESYCQWHSGLTEVIDIYQDGNLYQPNGVKNVVSEKQIQRDCIFFHSWQHGKGIGLIKKHDRVIITMDDMEDNILCLNKLLYVGVQGKIHVRCTDELLKKAQHIPWRTQYVIEDKKPVEVLKVTAFGDDAELYAREVLLGDEAYKEAKHTHVNYVSECKRKDIKTKYASCRTCQLRDDEKCGDCWSAGDTWNDLSLFEKASNIAAADHLPVKRVMIDELLRELDCREPNELFDFFSNIDMYQWTGMDCALTEAQHFYPTDSEKARRLADALGEFLRVEHDRWCRFHFIHNWHYSPVRNNRLREHHDLLPFEELPFTEQRKDWYNYQEFFRNRQVEPVFVEPNEVFGNNHQ